MAPAEQNKSLKYPLDNTSTILRKPRFNWVALFLIGSSTDIWKMTPEKTSYLRIGEETLKCLVPRYKPPSKSSDD